MKYITGIPGNQKHFCFSLWIVVLLTSHNLSAQNKNSEFHLDEIYKVDTNGEIQLSSDDADVFIIGSDRKDVHVKIDRVIESGGIVWGDNKFDVIVEVRDGNIEIHDKAWGNSGMIGYTREEYVIKIEAPGSMKLDIQGDDGDYEISHMANNLRIKVDDGDIKLNNFSGSFSYFDLDDGDVTMRGGMGQLIVKMDDGAMHISDGNFDHIDMNVDDGDITLETVLADNGDYQFIVEDGAIDLAILSGGGTFDIRHDDGHVRYDASFYVVDEEEDFINLKLAGGNADVRIKGDDMSVRLTAVRVK